MGLQGAVQLVGKLLRQAMSPGKTTIVKLVGGTCTWRFPLLIYGVGLVRQAAQGPRPCCCVVVCVLGSAGDVPAGGAALGVGKLRRLGAF